MSTPILFSKGKKSLSAEENVFSQKRNRSACGVASFPVLPISGQSGHNAGATARVQSATSTNARDPKNSSSRFSAFASRRTATKFKRIPDGGVAFHDTPFTDLILLGDNKIGLLKKSTSIVHDGIAYYGHRHAEDTETHSVYVDPSGHRWVIENETCKIGDAPEKFLNIRVGENVYFVKRDKLDWLETCSEVFAPPTETSAAIYIGYAWFFKDYPMTTGLRSCNPLKPCDVLYLMKLPLVIKERVIEGLVKIEQASERFGKPFCLLGRSLFMPTSKSIETLGLPIIEGFRSQTSCPISDDELLAALDAMYPMGVIDMVLNKPPANLDHPAIMNLERVSKIHEAHLLVSKIGKKTREVQAEEESYRTKIEEAGKLFIAEKSKFEDMKRKHAVDHCLEGSFGQEQIVMETSKGPYYRRLGDASTVVHVYEFKPCPAPASFADMCSLNISFPVKGVGDEILNTCIDRTSVSSMLVRKSEVPINMFPFCSLGLDHWNRMISFLCKHSDIVLFRIPFKRGKSLFSSIRTFRRDSVRIEQDDYNWDIILARLSGPRPEGMKSQPIYARLKDFQAEFKDGVDMSKMTQIELRNYLELCVYYTNKVLLQAVGDWIPTPDNDKTSTQVFESLIPPPSLQPSETWKDLPHSWAISVGEEESLPTLIQRGGSSALVLDAFSQLTEAPGCAGRIATQDEYFRTKYFSPHSSAPICILKQESEERDCIAVEIGPPVTANLRKSKLIGFTIDGPATVLRETAFAIEGQKIFVAVHSPFLNGITVTDDFSNCHLSTHYAETSGASNIPMMPVGVAIQNNVEFYANVISFRLCHTGTILDARLEDNMAVISEKNYSTTGSPGVLPGGSMLYNAAKALRSKRSIPIVKSELKNILEFIVHEFSLACDAVIANVVAGLYKRSDMIESPILDEMREVLIPNYLSPSNTTDLQAMIANSVLRKASTRQYWSCTPGEHARRGLPVSGSFGRPYREAASLITDMVLNNKSKAVSLNLEKICNRLNSGNAPQATIVAPPSMKRVYAIVSKRPVRIMDVETGNEFAIDSRWCGIVDDNIRLVTDESLSYVTLSLFSILSCIPLSTGFGVWRTTSISDTMPLSSIPDTPGAGVEVSSFCHLLGSVTDLSVPVVSISGKVVLVRDVYIDPSLVPWNAVQHDKLSSDEASFLHGVRDVGLFSAEGRTSENVTKLLEKLKKDYPDFVYPSNSGAEEIEKKPPKTAGAILSRATGKLKTAIKAADDIKRSELKAKNIFEDEIERLVKIVDFSGTHDPRPQTPFRRRMETSFVPDYKDGMFGNFTELHEQASPKTSGSKLKDRFRKINL